MATSADGILQSGSDIFAAGAPGTIANKTATADWSVVKRVAFRFCFVYFTLFCVSTQIIGSLFPNPLYYITPIGDRWPMRQLTAWTARHVFHVAHPLLYANTGSGDRTFDWVNAFCLLIIALAATLVWSGLDRKRSHYAALYRWFRLGIRFALASELFSYGVNKIIPNQMPFPSLTRLLEPYGNFSPMGTLWFSVGASHAYEVLTGCAETLGGILLVAPRTTTLGALVALADMIYVFTLNMTFDVPVKLFSFHLILLALFVLAPDIGRLSTFFFTNRTVNARPEARSFRSLRANRIALAVQLIFGAYLIVTCAYGSIQGWRQYGDGRPKSALYGIWNVEEMSIDGVVRSPLTTDKDRWRRVVFDFVNATSFQQMDDTFIGYASTIDSSKGTLTLTRYRDPKWKALFTYERPAPDQLMLNGSMDGHKIDAKLALFDRSKFTLVSRGFHWISEFPFNR